MDPSEQLDVKWYKCEVCTLNMLHRSRLGNGAGLNFYPRGHGFGDPN
jgi:hypothetical protein